MNDLEPGGYYCNGPNAPGTIMDPFGKPNANGVLNINSDTGMKGITGCKWTDNAYFDDDTTKTDWSQDNVSFEQCNVLCSQKLEGNRDEKFLHFSSEEPYSKHIETGKICGFKPEQNGKGLCSIKTGGQVVGNATQGSWVYGRKLTKCNDIFEKAKDVTPEVCGFKACRGVAGPGYTNGVQGAGVAGNCLETDDHCKACPWSCDPTAHICGKKDCCRGCGTGKYCAQNAPCCGTGYGDGDGVYNCYFCADGPKCIDNNTYPCYWAGWKDEKTRDVRKLWDKANHAIA